MKEDLGRCSEHLRKTVEYMATNGDAPREKLHGILENNKSAGLGSIAADDFPAGPMREKFQVIKLNVTTNDEARRMIELICDLSDDVAKALGDRK
jgi:hypothetical protein